MFFFFFKQKTSYEMRISDWSSDVFSSDLDRRLAPPDVCPQPPSPPGHLPGGNRLRPYRPLPWLGARPGRRAGLPPCATVARHQEPDTRAGRRQATDASSDEHTSELQPLLRISYAVFCLKTQNTQTT